MSKIEVSLICTVYNEAETISGFLESVVSMRRLPDEMIIVDGGSTDSTVDYINQYTQQHPMIRLIVEKGSNIARGRNIAIRNALYDYVAITDAGTRLDTNWLYEILKPFEENLSADIVGGWTEMTPQTTFERWVSLIQMPPDKLDEKTYLPSARSLALKKSVWQAVDGFPEHLTRWAEDTLFLKKIRERNFQFVLSPNAKVYWRPRKNLTEFWLQYFRYGFGDGEARLYKILNVKRFVLVISPWMLVIGLFSSPVITILSVGILSAGFYRLMLPLQSASVSLGKLLPLYALVLYSETAQFFGYCAGLLKGKRLSV